MNSLAYQQDLHTSTEAKRRLRRRYRSQGLLKLAGILAISFATFALFALLYSVFSKAVGAAKETHVLLDVSLPREAIDPTGSNDPEVIGKADFAILIKDALRATFPKVERADRKQLYQLVSDAAAFELRKKVMADPKLIGTTPRLQLLAGDDADLYVKGFIGNKKLLPTSGTASATGVDGEVKVFIESNALGQAMRPIKNLHAERAKRTERAARQQARAIASMDEQLAATPSEEVRAALDKQRAAYAAEYQVLTKRAEALKARADASGSTEVLDSSLPSLFLLLNGGMVEATEIASDHIKGRVVLPLTSSKEAPEGEWKLLFVEEVEDDRKISDNQIAWLEKLAQDGRVVQTLNWHFLSHADASEPEEAGILGGLIGTFWTMLVTFVLAFPIGVMASIYLEEFAPKNRLTHFIEVNINNLAAVPSIVYGLLGLAVFINFFGLPYSSPLVGGLVLSLMTLPTIIIASRAAIKAVPPSIRDAALGIGASKVQAVMHHVLPLAMPGILTGTIIGMAHALGETAPLLMIGMVAFIADLPSGITDNAASLPVQIYLWADRAEAAFDMRTAAAIVVLLTFLILMNGIAILLRKRFERRW